MNITFLFLDLEAHLWRFLKTISENTKSRLFFEIWGIYIGHLGSHKLDLHNGFQLSKSSYNSRRYPPSFQAPLSWRFSCGIFFCKSFSVLPEFRISSRTLCRRNSTLLLPKPNSSFIFASILVDTAPHLGCGTRFSSGVIVLP